MRRLLSESLPLRTTRALGNYSVDAILPRRYGDLTQARFNLIRLTDTDWFAADHAMDITAAFVDALTTTAWEARLRSDGKGNTWTVVVFETPVPQGSQASACGRGLPIDNPAEIMEDLFRFHGLDNTFPDLRAECAAAGFRVAGSIEQALDLQTAVDTIASSVGAIWTQVAARLYPVSSVEGYVEQLTPYQADPDGVQVTASIVDAADILRISYDVCEATGRPQKSMELTAYPQRYGGLAQEIVLPWLRSTANAAVVGVPWCQRVAGEKYGVNYSTKETDIRPCVWTRLVENPAPALSYGSFRGVDPDVMVLAVTVAPNSDEASVEGETILSRPVVRITAHTLALPDTSETGLQVSVANGQIALTVVGADGNGLPGARVSLDNSAPKTTDAQGVVMFAYTPGTHQVDIEIPGFTAQQLQVEL